jgi:hypothetical protein
MELCERQDNARLLQGLFLEVHPSGGSDGRNSLHRCA